MRKRRDYLVQAGTLLANEYGLDRHLTATAATEGVECPFRLLDNLAEVTAKRLPRRIIGPHMRFLAIGNEREAPHVHYILRSDRSEKTAELLRKKLPRGSRIWKDKHPAKSVWRLLGYLFDQNLKPTLLHPDRPRGRRFVTGSQGISYGFPKRIYWKALTEGKLITPKTQTTVTRFEKIGTSGKSLDRPRSLKARASAVKPSSEGSDDSR